MSNSDLEVLNGWIQIKQGSEWLYAFYTWPAGEEGRRAVLTHWLQQLGDVLTCSSRLVDTLNSHTRVLMAAIFSYPCFSFYS